MTKPWLVISFVILSVLLAVIGWQGVVITNQMVTIRQIFVTPECVQKQ